MPTKHACHAFLGLSTAPTWGHSWAKKVPQFDVSFMKHKTVAFDALEARKVLESSGRWFDDEASIPILVLGL